MEEQSLTMLIDPVNRLQLIKKEDEFDCPALQECIGQSFIGITFTPSCTELQNYSDQMSKIFLSTAMVHLCLGLVVIIVIIVSLLRKHRFSFFQWSLLAVSLISFTTSAVNSIEFCKSYNFACEFTNSLESGIVMIMNFQLNFLVAWKLYASSKDLYEFAVNHHLPTESVKRRNKKIYFSIWGLSFVIWICYSLFGYYMSTQDDIALLWKTNFGIRVLLAMFVILFTMLFYLSHRRIVCVQKTLTHQANQRVLNFMKRTTMSFVICLVGLTILECIGLITQGYYGVYAIISNSLTSIDYIILESLYFIILTTVNLDFTLTTQVLADGNVLIIFLDSNGNELHKFYMNQVVDEDKRRAMVQHESKVGEWQPVRDDTGHDDITSDGGGTYS